MATLTGGITASRAVESAILTAKQFKQSIAPSWKARLLAGNVTAEEVMVRLYAAVANSKRDLLLAAAVPGFNAAARNDRDDQTLDAVAEVTAITDLQQAVLDTITAGVASVTPLLDDPATIYAETDESRRSILSNRFGAGATSAIRTALTAAAAAITAP